MAADKIGKEAINAYREQMRTKGANKEKPKKPKVVVRIHPARTSNAQFIQDMVNAKEEVDGEPMQLHMLTFDTELDNTLSLQKGGAYIDKQALQLKAFHVSQRGGWSGLFECGQCVSGVLCDLELHLHRYADSLEEDGERAEFRQWSRHAPDLYPAACYQIPDDGRGGDRGL